MIGAIIVFIAGWSIKKLWPSGILFLLIFAAVSSAIRLAISRGNLAALGEQVDMSAAAIAMSYAATLGIQSIIFLIGFGLSLRFSKTRKFRREQSEADHAQNN